ncbi:MAG: HAMP domain-containing histidine kinase [Okeania sp. SIO2D1]|nr:HAMP domain-containing histidine kinase [Okeania sp. SIO2D1]
MKKWLLQTLSEVIEQSDPSLAQPFNNAEKVQENSCEFINRAQTKAEREWSAAVAALEKLLQQTFDEICQSNHDYKGIIFSGPAPVLTEETVLPHVHRVIFTPETFSNLSLMPFRLLGTPEKQHQQPLHEINEFPLLPVDPLATEQFCLVGTESFALVMVLGENSYGTPRFQFSFEPEVIKKSWEILKVRLLFTNPQQLNQLESTFGKFIPQLPDYRVITQFTRQLLWGLSHVEEIERQQIKQVNCHSEVKTKHLFNLAAEHQESQPHLTDNHLDEEKPSSELELLQALTHEIRTPLTTIRTLTKLLLRKRKKLPADVIKRLETIDQECSEQINRMELIFRAAEMQATAINQPEVQLTTIYLDQLFQESIPCWQKQAQRRNVSLSFLLPEKLPKVVSNPAMLRQMLTGLMENFTRSFPDGGQIQVHVTTAGHQLKLQFLSQCHYTTDSLKSLGQLLMFQPETGSLTLNLDVTKNIFHALGGKLIVRQRPQQGEVFTVFLPLSSPQAETEWEHNKEKWEVKGA